MSDQKRSEEEKKLIELKCTQLQVVWALSESEETVFDGGEACANASDVKDDGRRQRKGRAIKEEEKEGG